MRPIAVTFWSSLSEPHGRRAKYYPHSIARVLRVAARRPHDGRGWAPATFGVVPDGHPLKDPCTNCPGEHRYKLACESLDAITLDAEHEDKELESDPERLGCPEKLAGALEGFAGIVHTTHNSRPHAPRSRATVWTSRAVTPAEHAPLLAWLTARVERHGLRLDPAPKDVSRLWYFAAHDKSGAPGFFRVLEGAALDVDAVLAELEREKQKRPSDPKPEEPKPQTEDEQLRAYLLAALDKGAGEVGRASKGERNNTLNYQAHRLAGWLWLNVYTEQQLRSALESAAHRAGLDADEIRKTLDSAIGSAPRRERPKLNAKKTTSKKNDDAQPQRRRATDYGNAERLVDQHAGRLLFVPGAGWHAWDGRRYERDTTGLAQRCAKQTVRDIYREVAETDSDSARAALREWARKSEARDRLAAMVGLAQTEERMVVRPEELDRDPMDFNVANGTIKLATLELGPHRREDRITKLSPIAYDPKATAPTWERFLARVVPDAEVRAFLQRFAGYSLTASTVEHCLLFLYGGGQNGKGVFLNAIRQVLGEYATKAPRGLLTTARGERHPTEMMGLRGARFAWCSETNKGDSFDEAKLKDLVSEDPITARLMRQDDVTFLPTHKIVIAGNHKPRVHGEDDGVWRRIRLVPFDVTIPEAEKDKHLAAKLAAELPGILRWCVEGCLAWQAEGLGHPKAVADATRSYRESEDLVGRFIEDVCARGAHATARAGDLYRRFGAWCEGEGERTPSQKAFGNELTRRGFEQSREKDGDRARLWVGLSIRIGPDKSGFSASRDNQARRSENTRSDPDQEWGRAS